VFDISLCETPWGTKTHTCAGGDARLFDNLMFVEQRVLCEQVGITSICLTRPNPIVHAITLMLLARWLIGFDHIGRMYNELCGTLHGW